MRVNTRYINSTVGTFSMYLWWSLFSCIYSCQPLDVVGGLNLFNAELPLLRYWQGTKVRGGGGKRETIPNLTTSPPRMTPALGWATMRTSVIFHLTVRDKVTKTVSINQLLKKGEPQRNRTEVFLLSNLTPYRWAKQADMSVEFICTLYLLACR